MRIDAANAVALSEELDSCNGHMASADLTGAMQMAEAYTVACAWRQPPLFGGRSHAGIKRAVECPRGARVHRVWRTGEVGTHLIDAKMRRARETARRAAKNGAQTWAQRCGMMSQAVIY